MLHFERNDAAGDGGVWSGVVTSHAGDRPMRTLVVAEFFPWPATNGGLMRGATSVEGLAELGELDLFVFHDKRKPEPVVPSTVRVSNLLTTGYPVAGWLRWRARWMLQRGVPTQIASRMADHGPRTDFARLGDEPYDLVWFSSARAYEWLGRPRLGPTVVDLIDLEDVKERQRAAMIARRPAESVSERYHRALEAKEADVNAEDWTRIQRSIAAAVDRVLLCSDEDVERIGVPNAAVVVNSYPQPFPPVGRERKGGSPVILLPATFDYEPNVDGATWLATDIAPLIRRQMPGARIRLVGHATPRVEALDRPPDITVTGRVPDMTAELARADVVVVPVRFGSGTRLKILEAFAHRVPVVSTTIGAEGLGVDHRTHLLIADRPEEFADAIYRLRSSPTLRQRIVDSAERLYLERFASSAAQARVRDLAREVAGPEAASRPPARPRLSERIQKMEVIAHYLPQFHPIPENDEWWGTGFTEWTNVTKARPLFWGHIQPHLPSDLGFYDLRVPEVREAQAELARGHGVTGFCYWHYWFGGKRLLERPFDDTLTSGSPDFPFCLAWANQTWSGIWHGAPDRILVEQTYPGQQDETRHFAYLQKAFEDDRYIRVDGRPLLFIYKPADLPEPAQFVERWQQMARDAGLGGLYLVAGLGESAYPTHAEDGFDAAVWYEFPFGEDAGSRMRERMMARGLMRGPRRYPYRETLPEPPSDLAGPVFPCVYPNWDNTPRSGRGGVLALESTPERFGAQVRRAVELVAELPTDEQVLMIKSWNEWAEGNYLEPDRQYGRARLEMLALELSRARGERPG